MGLRFILVFLFMALCMPLAYSAQMRLQVRGLKGPLLTNVNERLKAIKTKNMADTPQFRRQISGEIQKGLRALGYYSPTIRFSIEKGYLYTVFIAKVNLGKAVLIERVSINIKGQGLKDPSFIPLLRNDVPKVGDPLNHGVYDTFKKKLQNLAQSQGYFDSEIQRSQLAVADKLQQAFWYIDFETGERYRLGEVIFHETSIRKDYLRRIIPFKEGDYYTSDAISLFSSRLSSSNWFNGITVMPNINKKDKSKLVSLYVTATPRKKNLFDIGLGYSTDVGTRGKLGWARPWINRRGHSIQSNLSLSKIEQFFTSSYRIPLAKSPLEQYYTLQGGYKHENNNDTYSDAYTFGLMRNWDSFSNWQRALGLNASYNKFIQANSGYNTFLVYPSFNLYRVRQRGGMLPMWGDSQRYSLEVSSHNIGSDITFLRFAVQQVWIRSLYDEHRFIAKGSFGFIETGEFERVPPAFRYFAGGDRSIRGYNYKSISPRDSSGKLLGASRLLTGSLEYQYRLTKTWWSAIFMDSGEAVNSFKDKDFHTGAGIGIRWISPIGPIKLDIARPIGDNEKKSVHFYIGIGAEL